MEIVVTGRHTQVKQRFRDVVETKMNRVTAIAPDAQRAQIVLTHEGNPRQADTAKRVEITVIAGRTVVRAEASSTDELSALDMALDKLTLRLRRTRDRRRYDRRGYANPVPVTWRHRPGARAGGVGGRAEQQPAGCGRFDLGLANPWEVQVGDTPIVIRRSLHIAEPTSIDEALYEMNLIRTRLLPVREQGDRTPVRRLPPSRLELRRVRNRHSGECQESLKVRPADTMK